MSLYPVFKVLWTLSLKCEWQRQQKGQKDGEDPIWFAFVSFEDSWEHFLSDRDEQIIECHFYFGLQLTTQESQFFQCNNSERPLENPWELLKKHIVTNCSTRKLLPASFLADAKIPCKMFATVICFSAGLQKELGLYCEILTKITFL